MQHNETIYIEVEINFPKEKAFDLFVNKFTYWWPQEYTWSGNLLKSINIEPQINGMCYEIGQFGFRYDWGRVLEIEPSNKLTFTWQISPARVPEPNPDNASEVKIVFTSVNENSTKLKFEHKNFSNHGDDWLKYLEALKSEQGWPYILEKYKSFCEKES